MLHALAVAVHNGSALVAAAPIIGLILTLLATALAFGLGTAITVDRQAKHYPEGLDFDYPLLTSTTIPLGAAVVLSTAGYAKNADNTVSEIFVGVCMRSATSVEGGPVPADSVVRVRRKGVFSFVTSGAALTSPGTDMYFLDNQTVQTTPTNQYAGKFVKYTSATEALVDIGFATCGLASPDDTDEIVSLPVAASTTIAINDLVFSNASGYATPGATTADLKLEGIALAEADNGAGLDGAINVSIKRKTAPVTHLTTTGAALTDIGKLVWASGAQAVTLTPGNNLVGVITKYVSATSVYVSLLPAFNKPRPGTGDLKCASFYVYNPTGVATTKFEFPRKAKIVRMYAHVDVAPGGSDTLTATLTDGTSPKSVVITGSATENEDEAPAVTMLADTDCTVTFTDSASTAAGCSLYVWYELL